MGGVQKNLKHRSNRKVPKTGEMLNTMRAEIVAYMIYLEGPEYSGYVVHIFYLKYTSAANMEYVR